MFWLDFPLVALRVSFVLCIDFFDEQFLYMEGRVLVFFLPEVFGLSMYDDEWVWVRVVFVGGQRTLPFVGTRPDRIRGRHYCLFMCTVDINSHVEYGMLRSYEYRVLY